jgi:hypothetical protein
VLPTRFHVHGPRWLPDLEFDHETGSDGWIHATVQGRRCVFELFAGNALSLLFVCQLI